jgi:hypothetical protein
MEASDLASAALEAELHGFAGVVPREGTSGEAPSPAESPSGADNVKAELGRERSC